MRAVLFLALAPLALAQASLAAAAEAVTCNLEEVSAEQQMFCAPSLVYDEEGEVIGGDAATN